MNLLLAVFLFLISVLLLVRRRIKTSERTPPGSFGVPIIGQSLVLLHAMRANTAEKWLEERVRKYGTISKLSLFGKPTVFICGQAANKFLFTAQGKTVASNQPQSLKLIMGDRNLLELSDQDHKRIRNALVSFLKPESLKEYVGKMDEEVKKHLQICWESKQHVKVLPLMKTLTFNITCSILFDLEEGEERNKFLAFFQKVVDGIWSVPVNLPFTRYNQSLRASARLQNMLKELVQRRKMELEQKGASARQDLITRLLSMLDDDGKEILTEKEIIQNAMFVMIAGHDTTSTLITFIIRMFENEPTVCAAVLQEQEEIRKSKLPGESLTWEDLAKMKYTWRVAMETLRMFPPFFGSFRKAMTDIEYEGYIIPKGWQIFWVQAMTHMDNNLFPDPSNFDPSRFENQASIPPYCFIPFGGGSRICPGAEFARIETLVAIHYLVTRFKWKLCADNGFSRDPFLAPTQGLPLQIWPRKLS